MMSMGLKDAKDLVEGVIEAMERDTHYDAYHLANALRNNKILIIKHVRNVSRDLEVKELAREIEKLKIEPKVTEYLELTAKLESITPKTQF